MVSSLFGHRLGGVAHDAKVLALMSMLIWSASYGGGAVHAQRWSANINNMLLDQRRSVPCGYESGLNPGGFSGVSVGNRCFSSGGGSLGGSGGYGYGGLAGRGLGRSVVTPVCVACTCTHLMYTSQDLRPRCSIAINRCCDACYNTYVDAPFL